MQNLIKTSLLLLTVSFLTFACKGDKATKAGEAQTVAKSEGTTMSIDNSLSVINWTGSKPTGSHTGTVKLSSGTVTLNDNKVVGGEFVIDMNTITDTDLDGDMKANLEAHLKGTVEGKEDDFFNVTKYPTAKFEVTKVVNVVNSENNAVISGNLTLKDITKNVSFPANIKNQNGTLSVLSSPFKINRTEWGIKFMSNSFFDNLKDNFINDDIELQVNVVAR